MANFDETKQNLKLDELHKKEEEDLARILSNKYGISYIDLTGISIDTDALRIIPEDESRKSRSAAFAIQNKTISLAIQSPNREDTQNIIKKLERDNYSVVPYMASMRSLERAWSRYKDISFATETKAGSLEVSNQEIEKFIDQVRSMEDAKKIITDIMGAKKSFRISRIVEIVIAAAISVNASDIHVEPEEESVRLRFRLDGVLQEVTMFDVETYRLLLSRIKLLSGLKLNIKDSAQDGRFSVKIGKREIEIRSSVLPGNNGESIVLRLLDPNSIASSIHDLGIPDSLLEILLREVSKPNGMILNTGPTGSGKTTSLYAFLSKKKTPGIKIVTIEDPIEYHLPGIVQTQVNPSKNYDFANGLRSSLRQDPDVIMVGEIRDLDTAETAIHAALTGHLVFSTLHTNNAAGAFPRLIDLGVNSKILTSAINVVIAQRLVRVLCNDCKKEIILEGEKLELLKSIYESLPPKEKIPFDGKIFQAGSCDKCNGTGYKGRIGIFEAVLTDKEIEEVVQQNPSDREIKKASEKQEIMDMAQDGVVKIIKGITSLEEVSRVVDLVKREGKSTIEEPSENLDFGSNL